MSKQLRKLHDRIIQQRRAMMFQDAVNYANAVERAILMGPLIDATAAATETLIEIIEANTIGSTEQRETGSYDAAEIQATPTAAPIPDEESRPAVS